MMRCIRILLLICCLTALRGMAQVPTGDWKIFNNFSLENGKVIDTRGKVYFMSSGCLFSYNKATTELMSYNRHNVLSDVSVAEIFYSDTLRVLVILYSNGNIDLLDENGNVTNIPDLADATLISDKNPNDATFSGNNCYIATSFGYIAVNLKNFTVSESANFGKNVSAIAVMGNRLLICVADTLYYAPLNERHTSLDNFTAIYNKPIDSMEALSDTKLLAGKSDGGEGVILTIDFEAKTVQSRKLMDSPRRVMRAGKRLFLGNYWEYLLVSEDGTDERFYTNDEMRDNNNLLQMHSIADDGSMWFIGKKGLSHMVANDTRQNPTIDMAYARPQATSIYSGPWNITVGSASGNIYISNRSSSRGVYTYDENSPMSINVVENGFLRDITPVNSEITLNNSNSWKIAKTPIMIVEDPEEAGVIYVATWWEGIYKMKDGKQLMKYDWNNMPLPLDYIHAFTAIAFDSDNNLWVHGYNAAKQVITAVLPAAKRKLDNITANDWILLNTGNFGIFDSRNTVILNCRLTPGLTLMSEGFRDFNLLAYNTAGTIDSKTDDTYYVRNIFTDQDGKQFGPLFIYTMVEDRDGIVWFGTENGVFICRKPATLLSPTATVERVKVPRNDGTQYADYLLGNELVTSIAVDGANRKWIGSANSGLYLVSADGTEIIDHFTTDNSYLPTNQILNVACAPASNTVYVVTRLGVLEYGADASQPASDYSEILAYPNPVRPDYAGPVTIKGLMDNSLVKIADTAGNVIYQTRSNGGVATWTPGTRLRTGVYYILASQNNDSSSAVVAKILVVN